MTSRLQPSAFTCLPELVHGTRFLPTKPSSQRCALYWEGVWALEPLLDQWSVPGLIGHSLLGRKKKKTSLHFTSTQGEEGLRTRHLTTTSSPTLQSVEEQPISQIWKLQDILLYPAPSSISEAHPQGPMCYRLGYWSSVGFLDCMAKGSSSSAESPRF